MTMLSPIPPVQLLQQSKICPLSSTSAVLARLRPPPVTFMFLDCSKRWWEAILSGLTKKCSKQSTNGYALSQKNFSRGIHALPKRWNTCMEHNGDYIEKWSLCVPLVFNKLWDKKYLKFSFDSPSYYWPYKDNIDTDEAKYWYMFPIHSIDSNNI
jgi:hypothetical protein